MSFETGNFVLGSSLRNFLDQRPSKKSEIKVLNGEIHIEIFERGQKCIRWVIFQNKLKYLKSG